MIETLTPVRGCWVRRRKTSEPLGHVVSDADKPTDRVKVKWSSGHVEWVHVHDLESGFQRHWAVQDIPISTTRRSLGQGRVVGSRKLGSRDQVLVQLDNTGRSIWLPYENLRRIKDVRLRYEFAETQLKNHAEHLRLRLLAHALENWNNLTGSLDRLDVDPLPHQIQLVHRILSSGNCNWLIADDVGLGKTIEVGLLLAALKRKGQARRVLVVCPAGLVRQWQDEMSYKFNLDARIYGIDFNVHKAEHWKIYDFVIVSMDLAKRSDHTEKFKSAENWDVVVFDEGHKLTRYASGERADRYKFAEMLRPLTDAFILLSGTPHQGYRDRFQSILELVRPDLIDRIQSLDANPEIVADMILRNRKTEVTDADGRFIFSGLSVNRVPIEPSDQTMLFQKKLDVYLRRGYRAGEKIGPAGRAIGFVMTTYRKLSSSSIAAIGRALSLRLERLSRNRLSREDGDEIAESLTLSDLSEGGDDQENLASATTQGAEFFSDEGRMLEVLLEMIESVHRNDEKMRVFLEHVVEPVVKSRKNLLIFTEYRATQDYLESKLREHFPDTGDIVLINGSMNLKEKIIAIEKFNHDARFMISTEAGGEGINLHQSCHVMVNYDLPWNPARLVQRIGRLYRYGQKENVLVFNLHTKDSFDNKAIDLMMERVEEIVRGMAPVGEEFDDRLYAEILGDVLDNVDLASILRSSAEMKIAPTQSQIEEALSRAQDARRMQDEIFEYVSGYDPTALEGTMGFTMQHVGVFVWGMMSILDIPVERALDGGTVKQIRLPEDLRGRFPEFGGRWVVRVTTDRRTAQRRGDTVLLDFETPFFRYLVECAKKHEFDGLYASTRFAGAQKGTLAAFILRWQNDQGDPLTEEFVSVFLSESGNVAKNPEFFTEWLITPVFSNDVPRVDRISRSNTYRILLEQAHRILAEGSTRFKHPNGLVEIAASDCDQRTR